MSRCPFLRAAMGCLIAARPSPPSALSRTNGRREAGPCRAEPSRGKLPARAGLPAPRPSPAAPPAGRAQSHAGGRGSWRRRRRAPTFLRLPARVRSPPRLGSAPPPPRTAAAASVPGAAPPTPPRPGGKKRESGPFNQSNQQEGRGAGREGGAGLRRAPPLARRGAGRGEARREGSRGLGGARRMRGAVPGGSRPAGAEGLRDRAVGRDWAARGWDPCSRTWPPGMAPFLR